MLNFKNVVGVEVFQDRINIAQKRLDYHKNNGNIKSSVKIMHENFLNYNTIHKENYHKIYCYDVLTHIHPIDDAFENIYKSLKPNGIFVTGDWNMYNPITYYNFKKLFTSRFGHFDYGFVHETTNDPKNNEPVLMAEEAMWSKNQYKDFSKRHGFRKVEFFYPISLPTSIFSEKFIFFENILNKLFNTKFTGRELFVKFTK